MSDPTAQPRCRYCRKSHVELEGINLAWHIDQYAFPHGVQSWNNEVFEIKRVDIGLGDTEIGQAILGNDADALFGKLTRGGDNDGRLPDSWTILGAVVYACNWNILQKVLGKKGTARAYNLHVSMLNFTELEVHPMFQALQMNKMNIFKKFIQFNDGTIPTAILNYLIATQSVELIQSIITDDGKLPGRHSLLVKDQYGQTPLHSSMINTHKSNKDHEVFQTVFQVFLNEVERTAANGQEVPDKEALFQEWLSVEASFPNRPPYLTPFTCAIVHKVSPAVEQLPDCQDRQLHAPNWWGFTPLYFAARYVNHDAFERIIKKVGKLSAETSCQLGGTPKFAVVRAFREMDVVVKSNAAEYERKIETGEIPSGKVEYSPLNEQVQEIYRDMLRMAFQLAESNNMLQHVPHKHPITGQTAEEEADALQYDDLVEAFQRGWQEFYWRDATFHVAKFQDVQLLYSRKARADMEKELAK
ncbi:hypothetical protein BO94DRAFT_577919 [Aspergillus sclerotioniger CBS 115572]|uniref:Ankyrin n=1 Tax=Aspergillus sclerotioniger CBS 115572 TaxID=1450535 RepID=A0A317VS56_9EURO|nr:hypothetical protein BO94DRAFT_577919 [Aspergillus sclerotioniger CBS 115572]PWY76141.1 hypothetical protein BO94DRAFT_577919 [Aspergillus sclerotioniger CBS 115572]